MRISIFGQKYRKLSPVLAARWLSTNSAAGQKSDLSTMQVNNSEIITGQNHWTCQNIRNIHRAAQKIKNIHRHAKKLE